MSRSWLQWPSCNWIVTNFFFFFFFFFHYWSYRARGQSYHTNTIIIVYLAALCTRCTTCEKCISPLAQSFGLLNQQFYSSPAYFEVQFKLLVSVLFSVYAQSAINKFNLVPFGPAVFFMPFFSYFLYLPRLLERMVLILCHRTLKCSKTMTISFWHSFAKWIVHFDWSLYFSDLFFKNQINTHQLKCLSLTNLRAKAWYRLPWCLSPMAHWIPVLPLSLLKWNDLQVNW